jgi:hypothetical protein
MVPENIGKNGATDELERLFVQNIRHYFLPINLGVSHFHLPIILISDSFNRSQPLFASVK